MLSMRSRKVVAVGAVILLVLVGVAVGLYFLITHYTAAEVHETRTASGRVEGLVVTSPQGARVQQFLGIPYAKAPVGERRFVDPVPMGRFPEDPHVARDFGDSCPQQIDKAFAASFEGAAKWNPTNGFSEDCLTLNIWAPEERKGNLPVLVFIHGGGFYTGSSQLAVYDGKALAVEGNLVVVSMNYRLGALGFLATGDNRATGNVGLKDQQMALRWVQTNIRAFGGDPYQVTLSGESAGAACVGYHLLAAGSQHYFRRALLQSASPHAHWAFADRDTSKERSTQFIQDVGCNPADRRVLKCLQDLPLEKLQSGEAAPRATLQFQWLPTVDGRFLTDHPADLIRHGRFHSKDTLFSLTANEGSLFLAYTLDGFTLEGETLQNYTMFINAVDEIDADLSPSTRRRVKTTYAPHNVRDFSANRDALDKVLGDRSFTCPVRDMATKVAARRSRVFVGLFSHPASNDPWPRWMGVKHGDCLQWTFGRPLYDDGYTEKEVEYSKSVMKYWSNFARSGDPNGEGLQYWPRFTNDSRYLDLKGPGSFVRTAGLRERYCQMWSAIDQ